MNRREALTRMLGAPLAAALPEGTEITRQRIRAFDLIVLSVPGAISQATAALLKDHIAAQFPPELQIRVLILSEGASLSVLHRMPDRSG